MLSLSTIASSVMSRSNRNIPLHAGNTVLDLQARETWFGDDRRYHRGIVYIRRGFSFRRAAEKVRVAPSTLWYRYTHQGKTKDEVSHGRSLTPNEEARVVKVLRHYAMHGRPLTRNDLMDVVENMVKNFPAWRKRKLRFRNGRPGRKFCRMFERRNRDEIVFTKPQGQDAIRYRATNAVSLVAHFAKIEYLCQTHSIDSKRIINADETGISPWNEKKKTKTQAYATRSQKLLTCNAAFKNISRITMLAAVHGNGHVARPMFVLQEAKLRSRSIRRSTSDDEVSESIVECLPRHCLVTTKKQVASVDWENFIEWANWLIKDTEDLRANGRKLLLLYDGYRSHLSLPVLEMFRDHGIIAYALPSHTSGTTQPLDLTVFPAFKARFRSLVQEVANGVKLFRVLDEFDVCKVITKAYEETFSHTNITGGFQKAGVCPLDEYRLFCQARSHSWTEPTRITSVEEMVEMLDLRRHASVTEILGTAVVTSSGFLDTSEGAVVTSEAAVALLKAQDAERKKKLEQKRAEEERIRQAEEAARTRKRAERKLFEEHRAKVRAKRYDEQVVAVRSLRQRRAATKERFELRHKDCVRRCDLMDSSKNA